MENQSGKDADEPLVDIERDVERKSKRKRRAMAKEAAMTASTKSVEESLASFARNLKANERLSKTKAKRRKKRGSPPKGTTSYSSIGVTGETESVSCAAVEHGGLKLPEIAAAKPRGAHVGDRAKKNVAKGSSAWENLPSI